MKNKEKNFETSLQEQAMTASREVINLLKDKNYQLLSEYIHPIKGIRFSPYANVNIKDNSVFTPFQISNFTNDTKKYIWGYTDGKGDEIKLTPSEYFDKHVYNRDFDSAPQVSYNKIIGTGNIVQNQFEVYPNASIVEFFIPGTQQYEFMDWQSLRLVFEKYEDKLFLVGIIHNQWTI
jgi:hypothetical protein